MRIFFMASDDVFYAVSILSSVVAGLLFRKVTGEESRRLLSTVIGVILLYILCGYDCFHFLVTVIGNCVLLSSDPELRKKCHLTSFVWNFGYLALFRTVHWVGLPAPSPIANAAQLFLTLRTQSGEHAIFTDTPPTSTTHCMISGSEPPRTIVPMKDRVSNQEMIGLAFDIHDSQSLQKADQAEGDTQSDSGLQRQLLMKHTVINPSIKDIVCFSFCYIGALTGPYFKYHIYRDWLQQEKPELIPLQEPLIAKAKHLPAIAVTYLVCSYFFNIKYVETDEFYDNPFWFRLFYMVPMFMIFRTRLYCAWLLSECMCITAGFAAYPTVAKSKCGTGPTDFKALDQVKEKEGVEYDYETVHNLDIYGCELAPMTKQGLRSWNMTVQFWLATYVHRRVPPSLKPYRVSITMAVSAFWHGIHPGYYLSFLTVPPILMAEDAMIAAFRKDTSPQQQELFDWGCWFFKMRGFDYMCMGFLLLRLGSTLRYWHSIYFAGHVVTLVFFLIGTAGKMLKPKRKNNADAEKKRQE